jgi:hypothetical protein
MMRRMTKSLEDAFKVAARLPDAKQDALASAILEELALDEQWDATLQANLPALEQLADEALADYREGRTELLDPDKL